MNIRYFDSKSELNSFMTKSLGWVFAGTLVSALTSIVYAYLAANYINVNNDIPHVVFFIVIVFAEIEFGEWIRKSLIKLNTRTARLMLFIYCFVLGIALSISFFIFDQTAITRALCMVALYFGLMFFWDAIQRLILLLYPLYLLLAFYH